MYVFVLGIIRRRFLVQAERARVQKVKKDREVKRKQHQTQQVHGERVFPEGKQNEESPPKHESEALRIARRKSEASRVALEQAESDADRVALLRARRDIALEQKEKGRPGGKRKSEAEVRAFMRMLAFLSAEQPKLWQCEQNSLLKIVCRRRASFKFLSDASRGSCCSRCGAAGSTRARAGCEQLGSSKGSARCDVGA